MPVVEAFSKLKS